MLYDTLPVHQMTTLKSHQRDLAVRSWNKRESQTRNAHVFVSRREIIEECRSFGRECPVRLYLSRNATMVYASPSSSFGSNRAHHATYPRRSLDARISRREDLVRAATRKIFINTCRNTLYIRRGFTRATRKGSVLKAAFPYEFITIHADFLWRSRAVHERFLSIRRTFTIDLRTANVSG